MQVSGEFDPNAIDKNIEKQREEQECGAKHLDAISTVRDPVEERIPVSEQQKMLVDETPQLGSPNTSYEAYDTVDTTTERETEEVR